MPLCSSQLRGLVSAAAAAAAAAAAGSSAAWGLAYALPSEMEESLLHLLLQKHLMSC